MSLAEQKSLAKQKALLWVFTFVPSLNYEVDFGGKLRGNDEDVDELLRGCLGNKGGGGRCIVLWS